MDNRYFVWTYSQSQNESNKSALYQQFCGHEKQRTANQNDDTAHSFSFGLLANSFHRNSSSFWTNSFGRPPEKRTFRVWYLIANPRGLPKEFVQKELEFRWKLFANRPKERK